MLKRAVLTALAVLMAAMLAGCSVLTKIEEFVTGGEEVLAVNEFYVYLNLREDGEEGAVQAGEDEQEEEDATPDVELIRQIAPGENASFGVILEEDPELTNLSTKRGVGIGSTPEEVALAYDGIVARAAIEVKKAKDAYMTLDKYINNLGNYTVQQDLLDTGFCDYSVTYHTAVYDGVVMESKEWRDMTDEEFQAMEDKMDNYALAFYFKDNAVKDVMVSAY